MVGQHQDEKDVVVVPVYYPFLSHSCSSVVSAALKYSLNLLAAG